MPYRILARPLSVAALLAVLCVGFGTAQPNPVAAGDFDGPLQGDVTCDDAVDLDDALDLLRGVSLIEPFADCLSEAGDVDCDNRIDTADALAVLRFAAGISPALPAGTPGCSAVGAVLVSPPSGEELIAAALEAGDITYEQSLLYRAYALYDHQDLPDEFRSPIRDLHAGTFLSTEIAAHEGELSQALLDQIEPFFARPADPISIFNNPPQAQGQLDPAAAVTWSNESAAGGKARVWIKDDVPNGTALRNKWAAEVTRIWPLLPAMLRYGIDDTPGAPGVNPDSAIDIYLVNAGSVDPRAAGCSATPTPRGCSPYDRGGALTKNAAPHVGNTWSAYIFVDQNIPSPDMTTVIAHELIHWGQYAIDAYEGSWLMDATAEWGGMRIAQELGVSRRPSYEYLPDFFRGLNKPLTRDTQSDLNRYGSYLYFLFASMEAGNGIVKSIWQHAAANGEQNEMAVDAVFPFADHFSDFAVRNWNRDPVHPLYRSPKPGDPTFPSARKPKLAAPSKELQGEQTDLLGPDVKQLSSGYFRYTFGNSARTVRFENLLAGDLTARLRAIVKIGNDWKEPQDWSLNDVTEYCRDIPDENITEVILIISNADTQISLPSGGKVRAESSTTGCEGYVGWAETTYHVQNDSEDLTYTTQQVRLRFKPRAVQDSGPGVVQYDLVAGSGPVNWDVHGTRGDCTEEGQATVGFPGVPYDPASVTPAGYMSVVGTDGGDHHGIVIQAYDLANHFTVTCPGDPPTVHQEGFEAAYLLLIISEPNSHDGDKTILKGHQVYDPPCPPPAPSCPTLDWTQTFDWELKPVGPVPVP